MNIDTETFLKSILDRDALPHAMLFVGASIKEMQKSAHSLIWEVFARSGSSSSSLSKIERGNHPDIKELFPSTKAGFYTIEQVREFCQESSLYPSEAAKQFFLIHYAERMQDAAANALLKTLEEPSPGSVFILLVENLDNLLPTIVSRAVSVPFEREKETGDSPAAHELATLLSLWPKISYNDLFECCEKIQKLLEEEPNSESGDEKEIAFLDKEVFKLFILFEKWYQKNKFFKNENIIGERSFEMAMSEAKSALVRSMKPSVILESLLLNFVSVCEEKL